MKSLHIKNSLAKLPDSRDSNEEELNSQTRSNHQSNHKSSERELQQPSMIINSYSFVPVSESRELIQKMRLNQKNERQILNTAFKGQRTVHSIASENTVGIL